MTLEYNGKFKTDIPIDLETTIESGQTFLWNKENGTMFNNNNISNENPTYYTVRHTKEDEIIVLKLKSNNNYLFWESTYKNGRNQIKSFLQLDKNIGEIQSELINKDTNGIIEKSINSFPGLRIINEPLFPTLISFICSTQMRVERIHNMINNLSKSFGSCITIDEKQYYAFPTPSELSIATEDELRDLKLGYRASYVSKTVNNINNNTIPLQVPNDVTEARKYLEKYTGVGPKVADCVLLYGLGFTSVVPVDTWIERAAETYYPNHLKKNRDDTARSLESLFGTYAGFAQAYLFHYMRTENQL